LFSSIEGPVSWGNVTYLDLMSTTTETPNIPRPAWLNDWFGKVKIACLVCEAWVVVDLDHELKPCPYCGEPDWLQAPSNLTCDFCEASEVNWINEAGPIADPRPDSTDHYAVGQWVACEPCQQLIERDDRRGLSWRYLIGQGANPQAMDRSLIERVIGHHETFWRARTGFIRPL
jgi:hypothetical protein